MRRRLAAVLFVLLAQAPGAGGAEPAARPEGEPAADLATFEGAIIRRIVVRSDAPLARGEWQPLSALNVGEPLEREKVRATLRNLRLAGVAAEVEIGARPAAGGVELEVVLRPDLVVSELAIEGESGLAPRRLLGTLPQKRGQPLREDRLLRGVYALQELLVGEGFRQAGVRLAVEPDAGGRTARVVYRIAAGARSRIGEVRFEGIAALGVGAAEQLARAVRARPGEPARPATIRDDRERLERLLARRDHRRAVVAPAVESAGRVPSTIDLAWAIELGPRFEFELVGAERKSLERRGLLSFLGDEPFDESLVAESIAAVRDDFQQRGHYRVEVTEQRSSGEGVERLRLTVVPGPKLSLSSVRFEGNATFAAGRLEALVLTSPRRLLALGGGRLVDTEVAEDLTNLRSFYALQGFDRARLGPVRIEEPKPGELAVVFPIEEGRRLVTGQVTIDGSEAASSDDLLRDLPISTGGPFHRLLLDGAIEAIRARLEERGYRRAIVEPTVSWDPTGLVADVAFAVLDGPRATVEAIVVRGNARTRTEVVRRFVELEPGDPISSAGLLDLQSDLYRLGIFSRVDVRAPRATASSAASEVVVEVEEGRARSISYGAGYDSESGARGLFRFAHANLAGRAVALQLDTLVSEKDELYRLQLRQPYLGRWPVELRATLYDQREVRPDFDVDRRGFQLGAERRVGSRRLGLFAEYRLVELETDAPEEVIPRESRDARVASLTPTVTWDRRDDPIDPSRGWSTTLQLEHAFPFADADAEFEKLFGQASYFRPVGRGVFAASLRAGLLEPRTQPADPDAAAIDSVPAAELFYAGGRTTHRAFARDELGIVGETLVLDENGDPIARGGGALLVANFEYRIPLAGAFGLNLFVDGGNVWRERGDFDPSQLRWGAGVGLRYTSPIGPLRLEIGWKLDREPFEDPYEAFVSLGNAF